MRKFILALIALLSLPSAGYAAFAIFQTYAGPPQITCNIITGVASVNSPCVSPAATCNGSADDAAAFMAFNTWARANQGATNQVVLTIPSGKICFWNSSQTSPSGLGFTVNNAWAGGINNLVIEGNGSTLTSIGGVGFTLGGTGLCHKGLTDATGCSARIQSVSAGASQVTLTAASLAAGYVSRFTVGAWIMLGGLDIQNLWNAPYGYPPNLHFFEWRQVTNVNAGAGVITLDRPLSNSYLSTWPLYNSGDAFEADSGGPATIYTVGGSWNITHDYRNLTINQSGQTNNNGRNITYRNLAVGAGSGPIPSQNETWSAYTANYAGLTMEVDKLIGTMTADVMTISQLKLQSSSVDRLVVTNSTITNNITGSAKRTEITDTSMNVWAPGPYAYGAVTGATICTRCAVTSFTSGGASPYQEGFSFYSKSSGVISFLNTDVTGSGPPSRIFAPIPNANTFYDIGGSFSGSIGLFNSTAITQDPTNVFVQTSQAGGFPTFTSGGGGTCCTALRPHPAPQFTSDASTGDATLVAMNIQRGATPLAPVAQFSSRDYAPTVTGLVGDLLARGKVVSLTVAVGTAYTGAGAATLNATGQFQLETVDQSGAPAYVPFNFFPQINLKQTGTRVIAPSGVTCNGVAAPTGCSGDSLGTALPATSVWVKERLSPYVSSSFSGGVNPQFTITIQTDQGVVP